MAPSLDRGRLEEDAGLLTRPLSGCETAAASLGDANTAGRATCGSSDCAEAISSFGGAVRSSRLPIFSAESGYFMSPAADAGLKAAGSAEGADVASGATCCDGNAISGIGVGGPMPANGSGPPAWADKGYVHWPSDVSATSMATLATTFPAVATEVLGVSLVKIGGGGVGRLYGGREEYRSSCWSAPFASELRGRSSTNAWEGPAGDLASHGADTGVGKVDVLAGSAVEVSSSRTAVASSIADCLDMP